MNGRTLKAKAIEVSPSSGHVLNFARDGLTPFPTSIYRPRPGDWTCQICSFSNFQRRTTCKACKGLAMLRTSAVPMPYGNTHPAYHCGRGSGVQFRPGDWICTTKGCNYYNFARNVRCPRCTSLAPVAAGMHRRLLHKGTQERFAATSSRLQHFPSSSASMLPAPFGGTGPSTST
jgi:Zn-finger in Ran binding protein and others